MTRCRLLAALLVLAPACGPPAQSAAPPAPLRDGVIEPRWRTVAPELDESSGLAVVDGRYVTHNDSGDRARLFVSDSPDFADAAVLELPGVTAVDWEDLAVLDGDVLVCDLGDNLRARTDLAVHRVKLGETGAELVATYPVAYPDGPHDAEAAAVIDRRLHVVTKDRGEGTLVFRFDEVLAAGERNVPERVGTLDLGDREQVTAADFDPSGRALVLLTYTQIASYPADRLDGAPEHSTWIGARQSEALCVRGDDLVFGNEQRDVFVVEGFRRWEYDRLLPPRPRLARPTAVPSAVPLRNAGEGSSLEWSVAGDDLRVQARLVFAGEVVDTDVEKGRIGTALLLAFAAHPRRHVGSEETVLAFVAQKEDGIRAYLVGFENGRTALARLPEVHVTGGVVGGALVVDARIPARTLFPGGLPERFGFGAFRRQLRAPDGSLLCDADLFTLFRPYLWSDVE